MPLRSKTYGAAHPAFAVLINRALKVVVVAVRGSKGKKDHLIDIDFQYDLLLSEAEAKVPMLYIAGLRPQATSICI